MSEVKRYACTAINGGGVKIIDSQNGHLVMHEDYEALQQQLTATTNSLTNAQEALKSAGIEADTVQAGVMGLVNKLAELEKQEPVEYQYYYHNHGTGTGQWLPITSKHTFERMKSEHAGDNDFSFRELFTRPAPAIDLNAVRAEGVDYVAEAIGAKCAELKFGSKDWKALKSVVFTLTSFATQLRAGNAGKDGSHE
ncbi:hypothetical protein ACOMDP_11780 [Pantoea dispersa]|uniref:hypothetical protein n=1 Tax=Pantoea dispersa TaxID=59814 RepID=UPI003B823D68